MSRRRVSSLVLGGLLAAGGFALGWLSRGSARPDVVPPAPASAPVKAISRSAAEARPGKAAEVSRRGSVAAAILAVHRAPDAASRLYQFALRLRELDPGQYPALFEALRAVRSPESPELLAMLGSVWAAHDGPAAFAATRALAGTDGEYRAWHSAILAWAQRDPTSAQAALRAAGVGDLAGDEMAALVQGWAAADPGGAEAFLRGAEGTRGDEDPPAAVSRGFETIARARIDADPAAALAWYGTLPELMRERLRQAVVAKLAAVDPVAASGWLARDASAQLGASDVLPVLRAMRLEGFESQFGWASTPANPVTRESALTAVVRENAATQLAPLGEWLAGRAEDPALAPALSAYALQVVRKSPTAAVTWALSLDQPQLRQTTLNTVAAEWSTVNPRAAREWAQRTGLVDWDAIAR